MNTALTQPEHTMVTPTCSLNLGGKMTDIDFLSFFFFVNRKILVGNFVILIMKAFTIPLLVCAFVTCGHPYKSMETKAF